MDFKEYPKAVYKLDDQRIVENAVEEEKASEDGYGPWVCRTVRGNGATDTEEASGAEEVSEIELVRSQLDAAGIEYDKRLGLVKLQLLLNQKPD